MRFDRLLGIAFIVIGSVALLARTSGPGLAVEINWDEADRCMADAPMTCRRS